MRTPENILDDNKVRVAGSMQNRILLAMDEYAKQECNLLRKEIESNNYDLLHITAQLQVEIKANEVVRREHAKEKQSRNDLVACIEAIRENVLVKQMPLNYFEWQRVEALIKRAKGINQNEP